MITDANDRLIQAAAMRQDDPELFEFIRLYAATRSDPTRRWKADRIIRRTVFTIALQRRDWRQLVSLAASTPAFCWRGVRVLLTPTK